MLYKVIGKVNCWVCKNLIFILNRRGISSNYIDCSSISESVLEGYIKEAKNKGIENFPIILDEREAVVKIEDIL